MPVLLIFYRRHLPHWQKADRALFITWRLFGSLPRQTIAASFKEKNLGKRFLFLDRELDKARYGPTWLKDAAGLVDDPEDWPWSSAVRRTE